MTTKVTVNEGPGNITYPYLQIQDDRINAGSGSEITSLSGF
jgi:hypothetical protein